MDLSQGTLDILCPATKSLAPVVGQHQFKQIRLLTAKESQNKKIKSEFLHSVKDGKRTLLIQRLLLYIRFFCNFKKGRIAWSTIESLFDEPIKLAKLKNVQNGEYFDDWSKKDVLMFKFESLLKSEGYHHRNYKSVTAGVFQVVNETDQVYFKDFYQGLVVLCKQSKQETWTEDDVILLFSYIAGISENLVARKIIIDEFVDDVYFNKYDFKLAFKIHTMSSKRRYWLNTIADVVKKLSHYMGRNNIALRYLRGKIGVFPLKQSEEVHVVELESVLSVLLDSFARHNKKMNKKDLMNWFQKSTAVLVDSDLASVVSDISDTSFESTSKSISGGKDTYSVPNCQSLTKLKALKLKQTKDHYSITKNNFFLKTSDNNSNTSKLRRHETKKSLPEIYTQSSITLRDELAKHIEESRKKEEERAAKTIKRMRDHVRKNAQSYVNILEEEDNFSGMEDYIARKHNTIDKHDDLRSSFLKLGNEQEELRRKSKQKDQRDKVLEELSTYTTKTELQKKFYAGLITKYDFNIELCNNRLVNIRGAK